MTKQSALRRIFSAPVYPGEEEKTRLAFYISRIVPAGIFILILLIITRLRNGADPFDVSVLMLVAVGLILSVAWAALRSGAVQAAGYITIIALSVGSTYLALSVNGIRGAGFASFFVVMLLAGLLLGPRAATVVAFLAALSGFLLAYGESTGILVVAIDIPFVAAVKFAFLFAMSAIIIRATINSLQDALSAAKENANKLAASNEDLTQLRDELERRIQERTASLEKRAAQLQAVSNLARNIVSIKDLDALLPDTTRLVSEQFGFYHTGIFLIDEGSKFAILRAANSEGGRHMLARGHQLSLDLNSIVGFVATQGEPRIALDVGVDSVFFNNPDLPETRSEMALPLRASGRIIGVLDVQSKDTNAFSQEDISVISTLADQIAIAIENARLYEENQQALAESRSSFEKYVKNEWNSFSRQVKQTGFVFDGKQIVPLDKAITRDQVPSAVQTEKSSSSIRLPIKLRGQTIGMLEVRSKRGERDWTPGEISMLEAAAERAGLALENARLVESAQRRASRERAIGEISSRIGAVSDIDSILQTAVEELGRKLSSVNEVIFELDPEQT